MIFVSEAIDDFYLVAEELAASPSRKDGVDAATEAQLRRYGCDVIQEAGILLRLPQVVCATAQVLLHRFYCKRSLKQFDVKVAAMAAFWLACKLEEVIEIDKPDKLSLRSIIQVFVRVGRRRDGRSLRPMDPYCREYELTKASVIACERHMLRAFGFVIHVEHPHRFVLNYGQMLALPLEAKQEAWNLANDSLRTTLCVQYKAEVVACGILFAAARRLGIPMPEDPAWWLLFEVDRRQLYDVCRQLYDLYHQPRPSYVCVKEDVTTRGAPNQPSPPTHTAGAAPGATPPLRSPGSAAVSLAGGAAGSVLTGAAAAQKSDGETEQRPNGTASEGQQQPARGADSTGTAGELGRDSGREGRDRRRSSRSRSRERDRRRRSSRSRSRSRDRNRQHRRRQSRSRSPGRHRSGPGRHDRYGGRPPRDDRRRAPGAHGGRDRDRR